MYFNFYKKLPAITLTTPSKKKTRPYVRRDEGGPDGLDPYPEGFDPSLPPFLLRSQPPQSPASMSSSNASTLTTAHLFNVKGKTVLVSGGSSGIGYSMASAFIQSGAKGQLSLCRIYSLPPLY